MAQKIDSNVTQVTHLMCELLYKGSKEEAVVIGSYEDEQSAHDDIALRLARDPDLKFAVYQKETVHTSVPSPPVITPTPRS